MTLWQRFALILVRLHPPAWRRRYADEVSALVEVESRRRGLLGDLAMSMANEWLHIATASLSPAGRAMALAVGRAVAAAVLSWIVVVVGLHWLGPPAWPVRAAYEVVLAGPVMQAFMAALTVSSFDWTRKRPAVARLVVVVAYAWMFVRYSSPAGVLVGALGGCVFSLVSLHGVASEPRQATREAFRPVSAWMATTSAFVISAVVLTVIGLWSRGHSTFPVFREEIEEILSFWFVFAGLLAMFGAACVGLAAAVAAIVRRLSLVQARPLLGWSATFITCWLPSILTNAVPPAVIAMAVLSWIFASSRFERTWRPVDPTAGASAIAPDQPLTPDADPVERSRFLRVHHGVTA